MIKNKKMINMINYNNFAFTA